MSDFSLDGPSYPQAKHNPNQQPAPTHRQAPRDADPAHADVKVPVKPPADAKAKLEYHTKMGYKTPPPASWGGADDAATAIHRQNAKQVAAEVKANDGHVTPRMPDAPPPKLPPLKLADLSNPERGYAFFNALSAAQRDHPDSKEVAAALTQVKGQFGAAMHAFTKLATTTQSVMGEIESTLGQQMMFKSISKADFQKEKTAFEAAIDEGLAQCRKANEELGKPQDTSYGAAWEYLEAGYRALHSAVSTAEIANFMQQKSAQNIADALKNVEVVCQVTLAVCGSAGAALAKLGGAGAAAVLAPQVAASSLVALSKVAGVKAADVMKTTSEYTLEGIAVEFFLSLVVSGYESWAGSSAKAVVAKESEDVLEKMEQPELLKLLASWDIKALAGAAKPALIAAGKEKARTFAMEGLKAFSEKFIREVLFPAMRGDKTTKKTPRAWVTEALTKALEEYRKTNLANFVAKHALV